MDYEKKYKEAIKKAREWYNDAKINIGFKANLEKLFPELKESEDERIRKEMIFYFQEEIPQCSIQEHSDKMRKFISWLKRQEVERTKLELKAGNSYFCYKSRWERADSETFKKGLIYKCNKDGVLDNFVIKNPEQHFIEIKDERIAWLEKQGKNNMGISEATKQKLEDNLNKALEKETPKSWNEFLDEQKSAWSEEDEIALGDALWCCKQAASIAKDENDMGNAWYAENWLKSLKDRYTWKPSDEQMDALNDVISSRDIKYDVLSELWKDLKKLREE